MAYSIEEKELILNKIFSTIEEGQSLRYALKQIPLSSKSFFDWIDKDEEKVKQYARATELRAEALLDEMFDIVDETSGDYILTDIGEGITTERLNSENIQRSRLRYDARKWLVSKLNPKKYGDKTFVAGDQDNPLQIKTTIISLGNGIDPNEITE